MEEFDRNFKLKIDSLEEVPRVEFSEEKVWRKITPRLRGNGFLFKGLIITLAFLVIIFLSKEESQITSLEYQGVEEIASKELMTPNTHSAKSSTVEKFENKDLIDSIVTETAKELTVLEDETPKINSVKDVRPKPSEKPRNGIAEAPPIHQKDKVSDGQQRSLSNESFGSQTNHTTEFSLAGGKNNLSMGMTHVNKIDNHFSFAHGVKLNRTFYQNLKTNEGKLMPYTINQIQVPLGIRYNLLDEDSRFRLYFYSGLLNSFSMFPNTKNVDYNLSVESNLVFDYRIFSTEDGKKGYLRFNLPLHNRSIINTGMYRPTLYDMLKR